MIPFCNFGVGKDGVIAAGDAGRETTGYVVVSWVVSLAVPCRIVFVLPVTVLSYCWVRMFVVFVLSWRNSRSLKVYHTGTYLSYRLMTKVA
jgi:hypothetical protein